MKILVTGGKGAIGSKLMSELSAMGHEPISYDVLDGQDLFDLPKLEAAIKVADVVYHLAAQANLNYMRTLEGARDGMVLNVGATDNVANLCAKHKKWLLFVSTMCVYGDVEVHPVTEDTTLPNPSEIYAASKYAAEWVVRGYGINFNLPYTILRIATVYGPGCRKELGVHVFFNQALKNQPITVHGDGSQERTLTYIDDVVDGCVAPLAHAGESMGQIFNISGDERISAIDMAKQIKTLTNSSSEIVFVPQRPHNTIREDVDVTKAERLIRWKAKVSFAEGLQKTLPWIRGMVS